LVEHIKKIKKTEMTTKQKIAIAIGSGLLGAYAIVFVYQRIQRAKADESNLPEEDAIKILREKKEKGATPIPEFTAEDSIPIVPNPEGDIEMEINNDSLHQFDVMTGMGDY
jgi:hypothetical protein